MPGPAKTLAGKSRRSSLPGLRMKQSTPAPPLILTFSPAPLTLRRGEGINPRLASAAQQGEGKGEGHECPAWPKPWLARAGVRLCPAGV
jgi:hypothetical protein